jgi:hypothetical protein
MGQFPTDLWYENDERKRMKTVRFASVSLILALLTACPTATTDLPKASSITVTGPASNALKVHEATAFTAIAKDSSGNAITGKTLAWTSSDEKIASVDSSGKVTAKRFGTVTIKAKADDVTGSSTEQTTYGLEVTGGTMNRAAINGVTSVVLMIRLRPVSGEVIPANAPFTVSVTGPSAWNAGAPVQSSWKYTEGFTTWAEPAPGAAPSGEYQASTTLNGKVYGSSFAIDGAQIQAPTTTITQTSATGVAASWTAAPGAGLYRLFIQDSTNATIGVKRTTSTNATVDSLTLDPAKAYTIGVDAFNFDFTSPLTVPAPTQFNVARNRKPITF